MHKLIEDIKSLIGEASSSNSQTQKTIQALRDTDYKDQAAYFKMVQLLKGLASIADTDDVASVYLSNVSDALGNISDKEEVDASDEAVSEAVLDESSSSSLTRKIRWDDSVKKGTLVLVIGDVRTEVAGVWMPGFGSEKGKFTIDLRYTYDTRKGPMTGSWYRAGSKFGKAPKNVAKKDVKKVISSEIQRMIDGLRKAGKDVKIF